MSDEHLVLLPGLDGTGTLFAPFIAALPHSYSTSVVSYPPNQLLARSQYFPFIEAALPANQSFILIAESFSGPLALRFAATKPANLKAIVLVATFVTNPLPAVLRWINWLVNPLWFSFPPPAWTLRYWLLGAKASDELVRETRQAIQSVAPEVLAQRLRMVLATDERKSLRDCEVPILYLQATNDRLIGRRGLAVVYSIRSDITEVEISGSHLLLQTNPVAVIQVIESFLNQLTITE